MGWIKREKIKGWKIKYYKGLGTSTNKEAQEYFANIQKHRIDFEYKSEKDDESIDMAFNKKDRRKKKLANEFWPKYSSFRFGYNKNII